MIDLKYMKISDTRNSISLRLIKDDIEKDFEFWERYEDPMPQFVNFLNHIKNGEDFEQVVASNLKEEFFRLSLNSNDENQVIFEIYDLKNGISFIETTNRGKVINMFDKIISDLLNDENFPYFYPCYRFLDENAINDIKRKNSGNWYNKLIESVDFMKKAKRSLEIGKLVKQHIREGRIPLINGGEEFLKKYKKMLIECEVPEDWLKNINEKSSTKKFDLIKWRSNSILCHHPDELIDFFNKNKIIGAKIKSLLIPEGGLHNQNDILAMYACDDEGNTICLPHKSILIDLPFIICTDKGRIEIDFSESGNVFVNINSINNDVDMDNFNLNKFFDSFINQTILDTKYSTESYDEVKKSYKNSVGSNLNYSDKPFLEDFSFILGQKFGMGFSKAYQSDDYGTVYYDIDTSDLDKYNRSSK